MLTNCYKKSVMLLFFDFWLKFVKLLRFVKKDLQTVIKEEKCGTKSMVLCLINFSMVIKVY